MFAAPIQALVLKNQHRVVVLVGGEDGVKSVLRGTRVYRFQTGHGEEQRLQFLGVEGSHGQAAAAGQAEDDRHGGSGAEVIGGGIERDLGDCLGGEVGELEFLDWAVTVEGQADGPAGAGALGQRSVKHPGPAEIFKQAVGDLEGAAVGADVLTEQERLGPLGQNLAQGGVDRLGEIELGGELGADRGLPRHRWGGGGEHVGQHLRVGSGAGDRQRNLDTRFQVGV